MKKAVWARYKEKILAWAMGTAVMSIVIMGVVVVSIFLVRNSQLEGIDETEQVEQEEQSYGWEEFIANRDAEGLIETSNKQIELTSDNEVISDIYTTRAGVLYGFDLEDDSVDYGVQILSDIHSAEECYPTGDSAYMVYVYEQIYGDVVVADEFLKIAEERGETIPPGK